MAKIKVLVVEDIEDIRQYVVKALKKDEKIQVIGEAATGIDAIEQVKTLKPDVVLMDIHMETPTAGLDAAEIIMGQFPHTRIITLTIHQDDQLVFRAYCAGVRDYLLKTSPPHEIVEAVHNVHQNQLMVRSNVASKIIDEFTKMRIQQDHIKFTYQVLSKLSNSEFEVLSQVYQGYKYRQIADARFVSLGTVKTQVNSILRKFQRKRMKEVLSLLEEMNFHEIIKSNQLDAFG